MLLLFSFFSSAAVSGGSGCCLDVVVGGGFSGGEGVVALVLTPTVLFVRFKVLSFSVESLTSFEEGFFGALLAFKKGVGIAILLGCLSVDEPDAGVDCVFVVVVLLLIFALKYLSISARTKLKFN